MTERFRARAFLRVRCAMILTVALWAGAVPAQDAPCLENLSQLTWKHRLIVVRSADDPDATIEILQENREAMADRDIIWFVARGDTVVSNHRGCLAPGLIGELGKPPSSEREGLLLIGRDGGVKLRASTLDVDQLYALIDAMPMRRREMRQR